MRRAVWVAFLAVMLWGCSPGERELDSAVQLRQELLAAQGCSFDVKITADYGQTQCVFRMQCSTDAQGDMVFQVTEPQTIAGISGRVSDSGGELTFDDTALHFDLLAQGQVSPVSAPWLLIKTLRSGYLTSAGTEGELLRLTIHDSYQDNALQGDIWVADQSSVVRGEFLYEGRKILTLDVTDFRIL